MPPKILWPDPWCPFQRESQLFHLLSFILQACPEDVKLPQLSLGVPFGYQLCPDEAQLLRGLDSQIDLGQIWHWFKNRLNWLSTWHPGHKGGLGPNSPHAKLSAANSWILIIFNFFVLSNWPVLFCFILLPFFKHHISFSQSASVFLFLIFGFQ